MSAPTKTADAGPEVELHVPQQRGEAALYFRADAHHDTPTVDLLDTTRYCRGCGLCLCQHCQAAEHDETET